MRELSHHKILRWMAWDPTDQHERPARRKTRKPLSQADLSSRWWMKYDRETRKYDDSRILNLKKRKKKELLIFLLQFYLADKFTHHSHTVRSLRVSWNWSSTTTISEPPMDREQLPNIHIVNDLNSAWGKRSMLQWRSIQSEQLPVCVLKIWIYNEIKAENLKFKNDER